MTRVRALAWPLCLWLVVMAVAGFFVAQGQDAEREGLIERTQSRAETGSEFVAAYVDDIFKTEQRLAAEVLQPGWQASDFDEDSQFLGFPAAVLLDRDGRAVALAPAAPELVGADLAQKYAHLTRALEGTPTVSDVVPSAVQGDPVVAFALPMASERYGVLSGAFALADSPLAAFVDRQPIAGTHGVILDSRGEVVVSGGGESPRAKALLTRLQDSSGTPILIDDRVVVGAPVRGTSWIYVLDVPRTTLLAPAAGNNGSEWGLLAVVGMVALGGILVAQRAKVASHLARLEKEQVDQRLRLTVEHAPVGMALVDLDRRFVEPNRRLCEMLGYSPEELTHLTFEDVTLPEDVSVGLDRLAMLTAGEIPHVELEQRYVRSDGSLLWGRLSVSVVRDSAGDPVYYVNQVEDVTEVRKARAELQHKALYDPLTGLANRSLLMDRLTFALGSDRGHAGVGVGFCDLDRFKSINDAHGHGVGDEVLKVVARRLQETVRAVDTVARLGGDEFVIVLHDVHSASEARAVMDRARRSVEQPIVTDGVTIRTSLSAGLAFAEPGSDPDVLLRNADASLYVSKNAGRGRVTVHAEVLRPTDQEPGRENVRSTT
ncbi:diguanylate cyclase domain-containing protein [Nocardioides sp.]|uniref:diguanylate cyclase domain-containing protein n=1 Tax=Nocardioides sp. TaxID=35761 RepID=UPI002BCFC75A|nr:diguanylate cyclase [Nocardioides sp.]HXH79998.1 diguanylate cyclase [Nocardioides sp.]